MKCIGFGAKERVCENEAGTPWSQYWCDDCDADRREHITKRLDSMVAQEDTPVQDAE